MAETLTQPVNSAPTGLNAAPSKTDLLAQLQGEQRRWMKRRRIRLILTGLAVSMPFHLAILFILSQMHLPGSGGGGGGEGAPIEIALVAQNKLSVADQPTLLEPPKPQESPAGLPSPVPLSATVSGPESMGNLAPGAAAPPGLLTGSGGGRGSGSGMGQGGDGDSLGGGAAGTSFFGVGSRGTRFAYIVDKSGSMEAGRRWWTAAAELRRSIEALPDFAYSYVVLYDHVLTMPPMQEGWMRTSKSNVGKLNRWLEQVTPAGGTQPFSSFAQVFSLDVPPDVVFFMTDGEIPEDTAQQVASLNSRGKRVVIHCIAFGDPSSQTQLKQIAGETGGQYRFVPAEGP
jgi:hypothetical protein